MNDQQYLIIGGSTKCGTTSLFNYFQFHPQVCASIKKESRYFWNNIYPLGLGKNVEVINFDSLFRICKPGAVRLEATPDYLYSYGSALKIKSELNNVKLVFILREPIDRLKSWFRFARQNELLPSRVTFDQYIDLQKNQDEEAPQHLRALEQGKYAGYLKQYIDLFGRERIKILFYENLSSDPATVCQEICDYTGISFNYFTQFDFKVYNKSISTRSRSAHRFFRNFKFLLRPLIRKLPVAARKNIKLAGERLENAYTILNDTGTAASIEISEENKKFLKHYYSGQAELINHLTGKNAPW
jgi:hypothetical protein